MDFADCSLVLLPGLQLLIPKKETFLKRETFLRFPCPAPKIVISSLYFKKCHKPVCKATTELVNVYCTSMDEQRDQLALPEMAKATLMWDGSPVSRQKALVKFFSSLLSN